MEILDYNVIKNNNFDRTKSYFSCYYKSIILFTDYDAKSYNFAVRYNDRTKSNELYVICIMMIKLIIVFLLFEMPILDLNYIFLIELLDFLIQDYVILLLCLKMILILMLSL